MIFIAETDMCDPTTAAPPLNIDGHGVEEILQAEWQLLEDITAAQEPQAQAPLTRSPSQGTLRVKARLSHRRRSRRHERKQPQRKMSRRFEVQRCWNNTRETVPPSHRPSLGPSGWCSLVVGWRRNMHLVTPGSRADMCVAGPLRGRPPFSTGCRQDLRPSLCSRAGAHWRRRL